MKTHSILFKSLVLCFLFSFSLLQAQLIRVNVAPDHADWVYKPGEKVKFNVIVTKNNIILNDVSLRYETGPEMLTPVKKESLTLKTGSVTIDGGTMKEAGFLRCKVVALYDGKEYTGLATAAFSPETIKPTTTEPEDFVEFWEKAKAEAAKIPLDTRMRLLPERCTEKTTVYEINVQNFKLGTRLYGILCVPKADGKYPAILKGPGAGVNAYKGDIYNAEKGAITLEIGIHGFPVTMDASVYENIRNGALNGYPNYNLDDKDRYYYKRVYLGCVRAVDLIYSLPKFDGKNVVVAGGSQGGALSIVTAALDSRIKGLAAFYPALSDMTGYLYNRAGGWPHLFSASNLAYNNTPQKIETSKYYDVVNFARHLKVPGFYSWGYNDVTCPPTSLYSAYNVITAPKTLYLAEETGHWTHPEQWEKAWNFLFEQLKN
ncbi:MAG: acetylxylan esterase [Prevotellaceae bacterium]|jgi:cephalosporin-C deacetylase-like acetyl esterase|nr:acetylxylan esterase [Prevotellaceae bacterium]